MLRAGELSRVCHKSLLLLSKEIAVRSGAVRCSLLLKFCTLYLLLIGEIHDVADAFAFLDGYLECLGNTAAVVFSYNDPVDYDLDGMLVVLGKRDLVFVDPPDLSVDSDSCISVTSDPVEYGFVLTLAASYDRRKHDDPRSDSVALNVLDNTVDGLAGYLPAAYRAVRNADPRIEESQIVVYLSDRSDSRPRVAARRLLIDANCR